MSQQSKPPAWFQVCLFLLIFGLTVFTWGHFFGFGDWYIPVGVTILGWLHGTAKRRKKEQHRG